MRYAPKRIKHDHKHRTSTKRKKLLMMLALITTLVLLATTITFIKMWLDYKHDEQATFSKLQALSEADNTQDPENKVKKAKPQKSQNNDSEYPATSSEQKQTDPYNCTSINAEQRAIFLQIADIRYSSYRSSKSSILNPNSEYADYSSSGKQALIDREYNHYLILMDRNNSKYYQNLSAIGNCYKYYQKIPYKSK